MRRLSFLGVPLGLACIGFLIALAAAVTLESYDRSARMERLAVMSRDTILGLRGMSVYLVVESFDPESRVLTAHMYSIAAGQYILTRMELSPKFYMERRNARVENGMIVGVDDVVSADASELRAGTRAMAMITSEDGKPYVVHYILVGDPFPRP